ncbi:hypothetical protein NT239_10065 [Chitinibacter sp. SCUT-21]|uniref:hypothetical protein n=1 Tax=Chitinibacter sp. SCUT-21 TaxID=2970891 RepID=UPI0035A687AB
MGLKSLLVKAGLVVAETEPNSVADQVEIAAPINSAEQINLTETQPREQSLNDIYQQQGVASIAFPAERLLKILDGLGAMDPANQRAAVAAMDAADDSWDLAEVLDDANRKVTALRNHGNTLNANIISTRDAETAQENALNQQYEALRKDINEQIAQLHAAAELASADHAKALQELHTQANSTVAATQQEQVRLQSEIQRLESISRKLGGTLS